MELSLPQFVTSRPTHQNAVDVFEGKWVSYLPVEGLRSGGMQLFSHEDPRPRMVVDVCGEITGFKVLEMGPLEGAHSYQLERLGAGSILGIDASPEFYLKSLITKEILGLKANYLLGDFNRYLEGTDEKFDLVFCCGVLYHMPDPVHTLYLMSKVAPRAFIWTHYKGSNDRLDPKPVERHGYRCDYYEMYYDEASHSRGWSGVRASANRLLKEDIVGALEFFGYDRVTVTQDEPNHPGGPAISLVAERTR